LQEMPWVLPSYEPDGTVFVRNLVNGLGISPPGKKAEER